MPRTLGTRLGPAPIKKKVGAVPVPVLPRVFALAVLGGMGRVPGAKYSVSRGGGAYYRRRENVRYTRLRRGGNTVGYSLTSSFPSSSHAE